MTDAANVYGQALYELARDEGLALKILGELKVLKTSFAQEPGFVQLLAAPSVPKQERCQILDSSLRSQVHPYVLNFLKILTEKGYIRHFDRCCDAFKRQYNQDNGIMEVTAVTAAPLSNELRRKLETKLSAVTGKTIDLACRVDPSTLGGVRLDWDGKQLDGTVRRRLDDIRDILRNTVL